MTARDERGAWLRIARTLARLEAVEASRIAWRFAVAASRGAS